MLIRQTEQIGPKFTKSEFVLDCPSLLRYRRSMGYSTSDNEPVEIGNAIPLRESDSGKAILFQIDDHGTEWVPKVAIHEDSEVWEPEQAAGELVVKGWLASEKGWS